MLVALSLTFYKIPAQIRFCLWNSTSHVLHFLVLTSNHLNFMLLLLPLPLIFITLVSIIYSPPYETSHKSRTSSWVSCLLAAPHSPSRSQPPFRQVTLLASLDSFALTINTCPQTIKWGNILLPHLDFPQLSRQTISFTFNHCSYASPTGYTCHPIPFFLTSEKLYPTLTLSPRYCLNQPSYFFIFFIHGHLQFSRPGMSCRMAP